MPTTTPNQPVVTPAQFMAVLIGGIPGLANLLAAFHVYTVTMVQQVALTQTMTWLGVLGGTIVAADAALRIGRNHANAKMVASTNAATITSAKTVTPRSKAKK